MNEESERLSAEIDELSKNIVARQESLANQARSAQTTGTATSYINAIVSSGSLTEAISRISAMNEIADANNKMLQEQKRDKEDIAQKQKKTTTLSIPVIANKQQLEDDAQALSTKEAELKVAQLNLAAEKSSAENEKNALLQQKAEAEKRQRQRQQLKQPPCKTKGTTSSCESFCKYHPSSTSSGSGSNTCCNTSGSGSNTCCNTSGSCTNSSSSSTCCSNSSSGSTSSNYFVQLIVHLHHLIQLVNVHGVRRHWLHGQGDYWGNGGQWAASAAAAGFRTGSQPQVGAIACWNDGGYGHVAVVTAVQSTTSIQVSESNYNGIRSIGNYRGWFNPTTAQGTVTYIYPN